MEPAEEPDMTQHRHTIPKGANQTASVTDPDLTPYAKAADLKALATRVSALEDAKPTPAPVPTPTPVPPPVTPPSTRPWAAPVTTGTYNVPGTVTHDGSADASAALNAFIATVPNGSIVNFPLGAAATYRMDHGIVITGRSNLVFQGNGAALHANGSGSVIHDSLFCLDQGNSHISILNFILVGNNPNVTMIYNIGTENQSTFAIWGSSYVEIGNCTGSHAYGDFAYINGTGNTNAPCDSLWFHDSTGTYLGRNAISPINATNLIVEHCNFDLIGQHVFDIEPDVAAQLNAYITFRNNVIGRYGYNSTYTSYFLAADGAAGSTLHDLTVTGNTVVGNPAQGNGYGPVGLNTTIEVARRSNVIFTGNSTTQSVPGPALLFAHVDGLTITGNTQPLSSGSLASITDCTGVVGP